MASYYKVFVDGDTDMKLNDRKEAYRKVKEFDPHYGAQFKTKRSAKRLADKIEKATGIKMTVYECSQGPSLSEILGQWLS